MRLTVGFPPYQSPESKPVSTCPEVWKSVCPKIPTAAILSSRAGLKRKRDIAEEQIAGPSRQNVTVIENTTITKLTADAMRKVVENFGLESNPEPFECPICFIPCKAPQLVILRGCLHRFCRECLANTVKHAADVLVKCPSKVDDVSCQNVIQDVHIRDLLSDDDYNVYLKRSVRKSQGLTDNAFHCGTPDCTGWCVVQGNATSFRCSICSAENCLQCKAQHAGKSCQEYQSTRDRSKDPDLDNMIALGTALRCPKCNCLLTKTGGCDYVRCGVCQTAICWVTQGPRWGPEGEGDTSGGCRCGVGGKLCHPCCAGCHHA